MTDTAATELVGLLGTSGACTAAGRSRATHYRHPAKVKPELVAHGPNQVWSWDITKLHGPAKWTYFYLYATRTLRPRSA